MSVKQQAIDIVNNSRAQVTAVFDSIIDQLNALPETDDVSQLQAEIETLKGQIAEVRKALEADEAAIQSEKDKETQLQSQLDSSQAKIAAIKAALEG